MKGWKQRAHLLLLDRLQDLDDALLLVLQINALKDFAVFASAHFPQHLVVVLVPVKY